jgi:hypothetical protein
MFGLPLPLLAGAAVAFGLLVAALGVQTWRLDSATEARGKAEAAIEERDRLLADRDRKIAAQNLAVDRMAEAGELAKAERDRAIAAAAEEIRFYRSRADALRPPERAAKAPAGAGPVTPSGAAIASPAPAGGERTAASAVAEVRRRLRP